MASMQNHVGKKFLLCYRSSGGSPHQPVPQILTQGCLLKSGLSNFRRERHPVV